ncbi:GntR family transcriptional regulator [Clostridium thermarum]|uniref:GntR family transcriptional regulator n=1 Tax=Clostridium thermarum TaxID=1716543 RepID=UPI001122D1E2|nr:GntR family transcriptional regulator [Clostridium thermarum]
MNIIISNSSQQPIYEQIVSQIKQAIMMGELREGEPLPSMRTLAKELQISIITTKRAYDELEAEGFIVTVQGKGTYVAPQNLELIKESRLKIVEESLTEAMEAGKQIGLSLDDFIDMIKLLYQSE